MAWPDFSEATFAFAFLREVEQLHGGFSFLPLFFTQPQEGLHGVDAAINLNGSLSLFQFKRSEVMTAAAGEFTSGKFLHHPVFRMHLRRKNGFFQHNILQTLECYGWDVMYAASGAQGIADLNAQFLTSSVVRNAGIFSPSSIALPNTTEPHHVSFDHASNNFEVFSQEGRRGRRAVFDAEEFKRHIAARVADDDSNRTKLQTLIKLGGDNLYFDKNPGLFRQAALVAHMRFDSQIVFVPQQ